MDTVRRRSALFAFAFLLASCEPSTVEPNTQLAKSADNEISAFAEQDEGLKESELAAGDEPPVNPSTGELLPMPFSEIWRPWVADYDGMVARRVIRALVPYGGYQFYFEKGQPRGAIYELVQRFEAYVNEQLGRGNTKVYVVVIPVSRDELLPALRDGHGDFVAADLTITDDRAGEFSFSQPLLKHVNEVVVTGPGAPELNSLDALAGQDVFVRRSSSYYEHLQRLSASMIEREIEPPELKLVDELLETEAILEMLNAGIFSITVIDAYKARFWSKVFPDIVVRDDIVVNEGGSIGWATRNDSQELMRVLNQFLHSYGRGTLVGNDTFNRYLADASRVRCAHEGERSRNLDEVAEIYRGFGEQYDFDWLMLAAQGFQESGLRQDRRSSAGAVGIMQIKPSTAAAPNVGINDVSTIENNVHAGAKYLRFLADRYFADDGINDFNQWLLSLAAYNAGPARIASIRREAREAGYDPNVWFNNVEVVAARRIGRETVGYVSNIFKYYLGYQIVRERGGIRAERHGETLSGCEATTSGP